MDSKGKHWLRLGLVVIIVVAVIYGLWRYVGSSRSVQEPSSNPMTTPTSSLKTYSNDKYNFSFKYPNEWEQSKKESTSDEDSIANKDLLFKVEFFDQKTASQITCVNDQKSDHQSSTSLPDCQSILADLSAQQKAALEGPKHAPNIFVRVSVNPKNLKVKDWLIEHYQVSNTELANYQVGSEITLADEKGYISSIGCCAGYDKSYVIGKGQYIYQLGTNEKTNAEMPDYFAQIARSFRLDNEEAAAKKIYANTRFGYTVKYPSDMEAMHMGQGSLAADSQEVAFFDKTNPSYSLHLIGYSGDADAADYAIDIRGRNLDPKLNAGNPDKKVGEISKITLAGREASQFTVTDSYEDSYGGFSLESSDEHKVILVNTKKAKLAIIYHPASQALTEIVQSLTLE